MSDPLDTPPPKRGFPLVPALVALLLVGGGVGAYALQARASAGPEILAVAIEKGNIKATVAATGGLEAISTVTVGSQVSGPVRQVLVDFNSQVKEGDVLAVLDPSEFEAKVRESEAGLELATADIASAQANLTGADASIQRVRTNIEGARAALHRAESAMLNARSAVQSARAQIARNKAEMDNALAEYRRFEQLAQRQLVAHSELDSKRTAYRVAEAVHRSSLASLDGAQASVRQAEGVLEGARSDIRTNEAQLQATLSERKAAAARVESLMARAKQARAAVERAQVDLKRTVLRAPVSGTVIDRKIEPGQTVAASFQAPELFKIARDLREMQVRADVSEADIGKVAVGQPVTFTVDAYPDEKFKGKVNLVRTAPTGAGASATQNNVVVYGVVISAPNPKLQLKPGMTATVSIETQELKDVVLLPDEALRFLPPKPPDPKEEKKRREREKTKKKGRKDASTGRPGVVWLETPNGPERRDVFLGVGDGKFTQLKDGDVKPGDKVCTKVLEDNSRKGFRISL